MYVYREGAPLRRQMYLDDPLQARRSAITSAKGVELPALLDVACTKDLEPSEMAKYATIRS